MKNRSAPAYYSTRLNSSTHLIIQDDKFSEFPYIYVKLYKVLRLAVVVDTGCGKLNARHPLAQTPDLKEYIDLNILPSRSPEPTHRYQYVVICTHCHFDHISGLPSFSSTGAHIVASAHNKPFISPSNLPANSLCPAFGLATPVYNVSHFAVHGERLHYGGADLQLRILHTPGHTPDSLAIYDEQERWIFIGDTCYLRRATMPWGIRQAAPIIFPLQGDWGDFLHSLSELERLVKVESGKDGARALRVACGHTTSDALAEEFLEEVTEFARRVAEGDVPVQARLQGDEVAPGGSLGDGVFVLWQDDGDPEYSMCAPERFERAFRHLRASQTSRNRNKTSGEIIS